MITSKETTLTYKESTIRIVNQAQTVVIKWESKLDGSVGHLSDGNYRPLLQQTSTYEERPSHLKLVVLH